MKHTHRFIRLGALVALMLFVVTAAIASSSTGFEIEGDINDNPLGGALDWNPPRESTILITDPHSGNKNADPEESDTFKPAGKFADPANWSILPGNVGSAQTELTNIFVEQFGRGVLDDGGLNAMWIAMGMERTKKEGTFALDFEFNQNGWDGNSGTLVRAPGDVAVGFELSGNPEDPQTDLQVLIIVYDPGMELNNNMCSEPVIKGQTIESVMQGTLACPEYGSGTGWYYRYLADASGLGPYGDATMNPNAFTQQANNPPGYQSYTAQGGLDETVGAFEFAEANINLTALGVEPSCPGFATVHAKSRSSLSVTSDLKDLAGPAAFPVNCYIEGYKFEDVAGDGTVDGDEDPIANWMVELLDENGQSFSEPVIAYTDANGYYRFSDLYDGTYYVREICPADAGYVQTLPQPAAPGDCGTGIAGPFTINVSNPVESDVNFMNGIPDIMITKECPAEIFTGDDIVYTIKVENTGYTDLYNVLVDDAVLSLTDYAVDLGADGVFTPGEMITLPASATTLYAPAGPQVSNSARVDGDYGDTTVFATVYDITDDCVTDVYDLHVNKDGTPSYTLTYDWDILKEIVGPDIFTATYGGATNITVYYNITVFLDPTVSPNPVESDWAVQGMIYVENPATQITASIHSVSDVVDGSINAFVDCGDAVFPYMLGPGDTLECTYSADLNSSANVYNVGTATLNNNNGGTTDFSSDPYLIDFATAVVSHVDETIDVYDDYNNDGVLDPSEYLGTVSAIVTPDIEGDFENVTSHTFELSVMIDVDTTACGTVKITNRGYFVSTDGGDSGEDFADIYISIPCDGCTPGYWQGGQLDTNGNSGLQRWNEYNDPDWGGAGTNPFIHDTFFNDYFTAHPNLNGLTMLDIVGSGGTSDDVRKAARSLVAAYLNESAFPNGYAAPSTSWLAGHWTALVNGTSTEFTFLSFHTLLDDWNNAEYPGVCPAPLY